MVGTTWYRRGFAYWFRRVTVSGFSVLVVGGVFALVLYGFFDLVSGMPPLWRAVCRVAYCALCLAGGIWGWTRARRQIRRKTAAPPTPEQSGARSSAAQSATPGQAMAGRLPALFLLPFVAPLLAWFLGLLLAGAFVRVLPAEITARRAMEAHGA
ncbi:hypothetical protein [Streptomyces fuscigenes]|uniref:hypothetical protein n=1 Tax=Streptomyces fuscigenes TaxID=1528880 RepID=UPI001F44ACF3|nr:hypothetical protein [Streptomyces fuscigenes]MCF3963080.1 hypothetical protein [Streptomyces fuscigenes]